MDLLKEFDSFTERKNAGLPMETEAQRLFNAAYLAGLATGAKYILREISDGLSNLADQTWPIYRQKVYEELLPVLANRKTVPAPDVVMGFTACEVGDCIEQRDPDARCAVCARPLCPECEGSLTVPNPGCKVDHTAVLERIRAEHGIIQ